MSCDYLCLSLLLCPRISATISTDVIMSKHMNMKCAAVKPPLPCGNVQAHSHLKHNILPSSTNDMLLRSTLKASVSLVRLLLFFTLEGCFAYDEMIVRVSEGGTSGA